jgi:hypothetical protein
MVPQDPVHHDGEGVVEQSSPHNGGQEAEKKGEIRKHPGQNMVLKGMAPLTCFLQLGPTSYLSPPPQNVIVL